MAWFRVSMVSSWNVSRISSASTRSLSVFASFIGTTVRCTLPQTVAEGYALVEHKAFAAPAALLPRHVFEKSEDAALEVIDLGEPVRQKIGAGLFAADAAGAEHCDLPVFGRIEPARGEFLDLAEIFDAGIDRAFESAHCALEGVAGIEYQRVGGRYQRVPVGGIDIGADLPRRVGVRSPERDDLLLQLH